MCVQKRHNYMNNFLCEIGTQDLLLPFKNKATNKQTNKRKHIQTNQIHKYAIPFVLYYLKKKGE